MWVRPVLERALGLQRMWIPALDGRYWGDRVQRPACQRWVKKYCERFQPNGDYAFFMVPACLLPAAEQVALVLSAGMPNE